jgi:hypothetical protein
MMPHFQDTPETLKQTIDLIIFISSNYLILPATLRTIVLPTLKNEQIIKKYGIFTSSTGAIIKTNSIPDYLINTYLTKANECRKNSTMRNAHKIFLSQGYDVADVMKSLSTMDLKNDKELNDLMSAFL